ncbi:MAG: formylmethanofuran dehydrogenase subunit C [Isosphaeraceae bacterium]
MGLRLTWREKTSLPVDASGLVPKALASLALLDLARLPIPVGNRAAEIGELFDVEADPRAPDDHLRVIGSLQHVRNLGQGLSCGTLEVDGTVGPYLGLGMSGGQILVHGDVGDGAGSEMTGGLLRIDGSAGDSLGANRPGSRSGMRDGVILVSGSAGNEVGRKMRRGLIAIQGDAADGVGRLLIAGTIFVFGRVGIGAGMGMKRGTLGLFGADPRSILPTFKETGQYRFPFLTIYFRQLSEWGYAVPAALSTAMMRRYNGDLATRGLGEILVADHTAQD